MGRMIVVATACVLCLAACEEASQTPVQGPDGHTWHAIECKRSQSACWQEAAETCPEGYIVADSTGHSGGFVGVSQPTYGGSRMFYGTNVYKGEMLVRCKTRAEKDEEEASKAPPPHREPAPDSDPSECEHNYERFADMAPIWAGWFGGQPADADATSRSAFVAVCRRTGDDVQDCLNATYASEPAHHDDCIHAILRLPKDMRHELDRLFVTRQVQQDQDQDQQ